ncbi:MAG: hypothetical protein EBR82_55340, partial [Caulobacteraceae bacterium]|nr:hypothetical protein [Caulobacteraceae bacterium]
MADDQLNVNINVEGSEEVRQQLIKLVGELEAAGKGSSEQVKELYLKITELTKAQETLRNSNASALESVRETVELWEQVLRIISGANEQLENQSALLERINRNKRQLVATASASDQAPFSDTSIQKIPQISEEPIRAIVKLNQALAETATYATFAADYIDGTFEVVDSQRTFAAATANVADTARRAAQSFNFLDDTLESLNVRTRTPYFLQFATFPAADIARRVGLPEVSDALFGLGSALGVLDQIGPTIDAVKGLTTDLLKMGGTIGTVANVVNQLIAQMGVTGVAGAFLTLTTLAAPVVAGFVALGAVLQSLEDRAKAAADQAERVSNQFAAEANVARQNLTTRQVQEEIAAAERALNIQRARQATLLSLESELSSVRDNMFNGAAGAMFVDALSDTARSKFNELADALGITVTRTTSLADVFSVLDLTLDASKTTITGLESEITGLQDAIANGTTATGDAAEAEQKLVTARNDLIEATQRAFEQARAEGLRAAQEAGGELANAFIQEAQIAAQGLTTEQVQAQIRDEERRSQALRRRLQQLNDFQNIDRDNPAAIQQLREFLGIAGTQINTWNALNAAIDTTNNALEQSTQSQMTLFNAIVIGATAAGDAAERAQELADAVGKG